MEKKHVFEALNSVTKGLSEAGISKNRNNVTQNYKFRGIDDVYNALSGLLAVNNLSIVPKFLSRETSERVSTNKDGRQTTTLWHFVTVEFALLSTVDGSNIVTQWASEALDTSDKGMNKAFSNAYKTFVFQLFCIPLEGQDLEADNIPLPAKEEKQVTSSDLFELYDSVAVGEVLEKVHKYLKMSEPISDYNEFYDSLDAKTKRQVVTKLNEMKGK